MKVDLNKVITALVIAGFIALVSSIQDFQNVKANVLKQDAKIDIMYEDLKEIKKDVKFLIKKGVE